MHRLLCIPELVLQVCQYAETQRDLYYFGSTCKTLWRIAENELWGKANAHMLSYLLPDNLEGQWGHLTEQSTASLRRRFRSSDEISLHHRCSSLHGIWHERNGGCLRLSELLSLLSQANIASDMSAQTLQLSVCPHTFDLFCRLFQALPSSIKSLNIQLLEAETWASGLITAILDKIRERDPSLKQLTVEISQEIDAGFRALLGENTPIQLIEIEEGISKALGSPLLSSTLTGLHLGEVRNGYTIMPSLAMLPSLEVLVVRILTTSPLLPYSLPPDSFPSLLELELLSGPSEFDPPHLHVLQSISSKTFRRFHFRTPDQTAALAVMQVISMKWPTTFDDILTKSVQEDHMRLLDVFSPLCTLPQLKRLTLYSEVQFFLLSDDDFIRVTQIWPDLVTFVVYAQPPFFPEQPPSPAASLHALTAIVQGLPMLEDLAISINFDLACDTHPAGSTRKVKKLDLGMSCTSNPMQTASIISAMFPRLSHFNCYHSSMKGVATLLGVRFAYD